MLSVGIEVVASDTPNRTTRRRRRSLGYRVRHGPGALCHGLDVSRHPPPQLGSSAREAADARPAQAGHSKVTARAQAGHSGAPPSPCGGCPRGRRTARRARTAEQPGARDAGKAWCPASGIRHRASGRSRGLRASLG